MAKQELTQLRFAHASSQLMFEAARTHLHQQQRAQLANVQRLSRALLLLPLQLLLELVPIVWRRLLALGRSFAAALALAAPSCPAAATTAATAAATTGAANVVVLAFTLAAAVCVIVRRAFRGDVRPHEAEPAHVHAKRVELARQIQREDRIDTVSITQ